MSKNKKTYENRNVVSFSTLAKSMSCLFWF